jgi:hypothetical protein
MTIREIYRSNAYVIAEPVFTLAIGTAGLQPLNMAGFLIESAFRVGPVDPASDPDNVDANLYCMISFGAGGEVISASGFRLLDGMTAADGMLALTASVQATLSLPPGVDLKSDVRITDPNGEPHNIASVWILRANNVYTA